MKKNIKTLSLLVLLFFVTSCNTINSKDIKINLLSKKAITAEEFKVTMESKGYRIQDMSSQFDEIEYTQLSYVATNESNNCKIEFYQFSDESYATKFFNGNESEFKRYKNFGYYIESTANFSNYSSYTLNTNGKYRAVSRIDNTTILSVVDLRYCSEVKEVLLELGYIEMIDSFFNNVWFIALCIIILIIIFASWWKLFVKAGVPGIGALIPLYNYYMFAKITSGNGLNLLLLFIPGINVVFLLYFFFKLAKVYGKSILFGFGLLFLWPIFFPILAFGKAQYKGYE